MKRRRLKDSELTLTGAFGRAVLQCCPQLRACCCWLAPGLLLAAAGGLAA
jgi:hypothetical protein